MQAVAFDHSATAPPADPISPLAGPLRGKKFPAVLVEDRGYETPCHVWQGSHNSRGYPLRGFGGRVKSCVNPAHYVADAA